MPSKADKHREMLADRQRIDAAMSVIEAAKRKALAQRAEYGKFLEWKVKMQRRERKQREEEEEQLRDRIEQKLHQVLEEHKQAKREDVDRWKTFAVTKVKPRKELPSERAAREEREREDMERSERREAKRLEISKKLRAVSSNSAPTGRDNKSGASHGSMASSGYDPAAVPFSKLAANSKPTDPQAEAQALLERLDHPDWSQTGSVGVGGVDSLTADQLEKLNAIEETRGKVGRKDALVASMFQKAKSRRLYATARMLADPPADYLMGTDLLRYVPADVMGAVDAEQTAPKGRRAHSPREDTFFITEDTQQRPGVDAPTAAEDYDPAEQYIEGVSSPRPPPQPSGKARTAGPRVSKYKAFDPLAWLQVQGPVAPRAQTERNRDEEAATLEWYKSVHEPLTRIKRRTERHQSHSWQHSSKHVLPPMGTTRFEK